MKNLFLFLVSFQVFLAADPYIETSSVVPLLNGGRLAEFQFKISTHRTDSHLLAIFPQPVASLLAPFKGDLESAKASLVRGRWKQRVWGEAPMRVHPYGSSMQLHAKKGVSNVMWTNAGWMFSSVLGSSFQSLDPELKSFYWITPFDIGESIRVSSNPNEQVCTENLERLVELLPCRHRKGLGELILSLSREMARTEFLQVTLEANSDSAGFSVTGTVWLGLDPKNLVDLRIRSFCPATHDYSENESSISSVHSSLVSVKRSLIGTVNRPERSAGKLLVAFSNLDNENSHSVEFFEQLPFFLVPLWSSFSLASFTQGIIQRFPTIRSSDGVKSPTYFSLRFSLAPGETITLSLDVYKKYVSVDKLSYSFEKGFDLASAAFRVDNEKEVQLTRGLVVVIPLADQTSTFNSIAITLTAISIFYGIIYRNFAGKRRDIVSQDAAAVAAREPPIVRLVRFLHSRISTAFS